METYKDILEKALQVINWKLRNIGCEHYAIITNKNKRTGLELYGNTIKLDMKEMLFGKYGGALVFNLDKCDILIEEYEGGEPFVSIVVKGEGKEKQYSIFMSFYKI